MVQLLPEAVYSEQGVTVISLPLFQTLQSILQLVASLPLHLRHPRNK